MRLILASLCLVLAASPAMAQTDDLPTVYGKEECMELAKRSDNLARTGGRRTETLKESLSSCIRLFSCKKARDMMENDSSLDSGETDEEYFLWLMRTCKSESMSGYDSGGPSPTATGDDAACQELAGTIDIYYRKSHEARQRGDIEGAEQIKDNAHWGVQRFVDECLRVEECPQILPVMKSKEFVRGASDFSAYRQMHKKRKELCPE